MKTDEKNKSQLHIVQKEEVTPSMRCMELYINSKSASLDKNILRFRNIEMNGQISLSIRCQKMETKFSCRIELKTKRTLKQN